MKKIHLVIAIEKQTGKTSSIKVFANETDAVNYAAYANKLLSRYYCIIETHTIN